MTQRVTLAEVLEFQEHSSGYAGEEPEEQWSVAQKEQVARDRLHFLTLIKTVGAVARPIDQLRVAAILDASLGSGLRFVRISADPPVGGLRTLRVHSDAPFRWFVIVLPEIGAPMVPLDFVEEGDTFVTRVTAELEVAVAAFARARMFALLGPGTDDFLNGGVDIFEFEAMVLKNAHQFSLIERDIGE